MRLAVAFLLFTLVAVPAWAAQDVVNTLHNLSTSGPGAFGSDSTITFRAVAMRSP